MKKIISLLALAIAIISGHAQGTVNFNNSSPSAGLNARFVDLNHTPLSGNAYRAQLYVLTDDRFVAVGTPVGFRTGAGAGYVSNANSIISIPGHPPGSKPIVLVALWATADGNTFEEASTNGPVVTSGPWQLTDELGDSVAKPPAPLRSLPPLVYFPLSPPRNPPLIALRLSDQSTRLIWDYSYHDWNIEYKTSLNDTNWTLLTTGQYTNRLGGIYTDLTATNQSRIYRIHYFWPEE